MEKLAWNVILNICSNKTPLAQIVIFLSIIKSLRCRLIREQWRLFDLRWFMLRLVKSLFLMEVILWQFAQLANPRTSTTQLIKTADHLAESGLTPINQETANLVARTALFAHLRLVNNALQAICYKTEFAFFRVNQITIKAQLYSLASVILILLIN